MKAAGAVACPHCGSTETEEISRFGSTPWQIDRTMRQVPDHFHAHARDEGWWGRRSLGRVSRYTGVGGERSTG